MKYSRISVVILSVLLFSSCEKTLEFEDDTTTHKLVVNSLFNATDTVKVTLSASLPVNAEEDSRKVTDAKLELYEGTSKKVADFTHLSNGVYAALDFHPKTYTSYTLKASHPNYASIEVSAMLPSAPKIIDLDSTTITGAGFEPILKISFSIDDPKAETNYYMVDVVTFERTYLNEDPGKGYERTLVQLHSNDPKTANYNPTNGVSQTRLLFSDADFNGSRLHYTFDLPTIYTQSPDYAKATQLRIYNVNEGVYKYFESHHKYLNTLINPLSNPVQVYTNINGGYGVFGGAAPIKITLRE